MNEPGEPLEVPMAMTAEEMEGLVSAIKEEALPWGAKKITFHLDLPSILITSTALKFFACHRPEDQVSVSICREVIGELVKCLTDKGLNAHAGLAGLIFLKQAETAPEGGAFNATRQRTN